MTLLSIGEFARLSRLSAKALRRYDELDLLRPERVDPDSGYRWYAAGQLEQARLIAALRRIGVPLIFLRLREGGGLLFERSGQSGREVMVGPQVFLFVQPVPSLRRLGGGQKNDCVQER